MTFYNAEEFHMAYPHIHNLGGTENIKAHIPQYYKRVAQIMKTITGDFSERIKKDIAKIEAECEIIRKFGGLAVFNHPY